MGFIKTIKEIFGIQSHKDIIAEPATFHEKVKEAEEKNTPKTTYESKVVKFDTTTDSAYEYLNLLEKAKSKINHAIENNYKTSSIKLPGKMTKEQSVIFANKVKSDCKALVKSYRIRSYSKKDNVSHMYYRAIFYLRDKSDTGV